MSIRDDFAAFIEDIGARIGTPVMCRRMHRPAYEFDGEIYPAFEEYEVREPRTRRVWMFDVSLASLSREHARDVVQWELER